MSDEIHIDDDDDWRWPPKITWWDEYGWAVAVTIGHIGGLTLGYAIWG